MVFEDETRDETSASLQARGDLDQAQSREVMHLDLYMLVQLICFANRTCVRSLLCPHPITACQHVCTNLFLVAQLGKLLLVVKWPTSKMDSQSVAGRLLLRHRSLSGESRRWQSKFPARLQPVHRNLQKSWHGKPRSKSAHRCSLNSECRA